MADTELKPCPFCGKRLERNDAFSTRSQDHFTHPAIEDGEEPCILDTINVVHHHDESRRTGSHRPESWNRRTTPTVSDMRGAEWQTLTDYVMRYGGRCRDCADEDGTCPSDGTPCDPDLCRAVVKKTLTALHYGFSHGFIQNPFQSPTPVPDAEGHKRGVEAVSGVDPLVEKLAIHMHYADGDDCTVKWGKQPSKYRNNMRRTVMDFLAAIKAERLVLCDATPAGWFNPWNDYHGYQQVAKECEGEAGKIPLYIRTPKTEA